MMKGDIQEAKQSSSKEEPSDNVISNIEELMSTGKRHYICNEPQAAIDCFVKLCELLSSFYGQTANECAEAYLYYGKSLLEVARLENGVLGNAVKDTPILGQEDDAKEEPVEADQEEECEKRAEIRANVENAMRDGNLYNDSVTEDEQTGEEEKENEEEAVEETNTDVREECVNEEASDKNEDNIAEETEEEDAKSNDGEVTNMQLSWEMLELCVQICKRMLSEDTKQVEKMKTFLADATYNLAQISLESEHYPESISDFNTCLDIYKEILTDPEDRKIAEIYYNIGLASSFEKNFDETIVNYERAVSLLNTRVAMLEKKIKDVEEAGGKEKAATELQDWKQEISELNDLVLLDMMAKIEDAQEMKKLGDEELEATKKVAKEMFSTVATGFDQGFSSTVQGEINDIGHKVRSLKRKNDPDDECPAKDVKKIKASNGTSNELTNGKEEIPAL